MSVKEDFPSVCSLLKLWGIGEVDSDLSDSNKIRAFVLDQSNAIVEQLINEFREAIRTAERTYQELGIATYWRFKTPNQCISKLQPILDELLLIREERYKPKHVSPEPEE